MFHVFRHYSRNRIYAKYMVVVELFRFLVHLVSWTNGVVGTVECAFLGGWGVGVGVWEGVIADTRHVV